MKQQYFAFALLLSAITSGYGQNIFPATGNVGVGIATPVTLLNINQGAGNATTGTASFRIGGTSNYPSLEFGIKGAYDGMISTYGNDLHIYAGNWRSAGATATENHNLSFYTSQASSSNWNTPKMYLRYDGNLGIGTITPNINLEVVGFGQIIRNQGSTAYTTLRLYNNINDSNRALEIDYSGSGYAGSLSTGGPIGESASIVTTGAFPLALGTNNASRMVISSGGNVGIGLSNPAFGLTFNANENQTVLGGNTKSALRIMNGYADAFGRRSEIQFSLGQSATDLLAVIAAEYSSYNGFVGGDLVFATTPPTSAAMLERMRINKDGNVGIGTTIPDAKLAVKGTIHAQEVKVDLSVPGPDYVFDEAYDLPSLTEIETYVNQNKHLPEVPSACEMETEGINLSEMNMILLKKVEELTLYLINQQKQIDALKVSLKK